MILLMIFAGRTRFHPNARKFNACLAPRSWATSKRNAVSAVSNSGIPMSRNMRPISKKNCDSNVKELCLCRDQRPYDELLRRGSSVFAAAVQKLITIRRGQFSLAAFDDDGAEAIDVVFAYKRMSIARLARM